MMPLWQIHRTALVWLLVAFTAVVLLHASHTPLWLLLAAMFAVVWRVQRYRGIWSSPNRIVKLGLLAVCLAGLILEYGKSVGLEPMVALLITTYTLKVFEMERRREALLVIYLMFFIAIAGALFNQSIAYTSYILVCFVLAITALIALHQGVVPASDEHKIKFLLLLNLAPLKKAVVLILQAIPLMLLLFIIMPRIGSLWSVPIQSHNAKTGMSDSMSPGSFSRLGRSADVVFRVGFKGDIPPQPQLYWRGLVLSDFDGRTWSQANLSVHDDAHQAQWFGQKKYNWDKLIDRHGEPTDYRVVIEPSQQPWLYSLPTPIPQNHGVALTRDFRLLSSQSISQKTQYNVSSWLDYHIAKQYLSPTIRKVSLRLPPSYNPRSRQLAQQWRKESSNDMSLVQKVLGLYNQEYSYTLEPPLLGTHSVDEFLFEAKKGFCEHFASSFTFMMRAMGIPARVVVGYQGGERHPNNYLVVRQYDAHAWAEVWIKGRGWIRVDPTAAVAPERIEFNLESSLADKVGYLADSPMSLIQFRHIHWLNRIRLKLDTLNYQWAQWVLGYDTVQESFLAKWLGAYSALRIAFVLLIIGSSFLGVIALWQLKTRRSSEYDSLDLLFLKLCKKLEQADIPRHRGEGPRGYANRVAKLKPEWGSEVRAISFRYEQMRYNDESQDKLKTLKQSIWQLKL